MAHPIVRLTWKDHAADGSWKDVDEFHGPAMCHSVGWIYREDDEGITIAGSYSPDDGKSHTTGNLQYILKSCIVARRTLSEGEPNVRKKRSFKK